jgi:hypothetical protein
VLQGTHGATDHVRCYRARTLLQTTYGATEHVEIGRSRSFGHSTEGVTLAAVVALVTAQRSLVLDVSKK